MRFSCVLYGDRVLLELGALQLRRALERHRRMKATQISEPLLNVLWRHKIDLVQYKAARRRNVITNRGNRHQTHSKHTRTQFSFVAIR